MASSQELSTRVQGIVSGEIPIKEAVKDLTTLAVDTADPTEAMVLNVRFRQAGNKIEGDSAEAQLATGLVRGLSSVLKLKATGDMDGALKVFHQEAVTQNTARAEALGVSPDDLPLSEQVTAIDLLALA